jgi:hypothetical protein
MTVSMTSSCFFASLNMSALANNSPSSVPSGPRSSSSASSGDGTAQSSACMSSHCTVALQINSNRHNHRCRHHRCRHHHCRHHHHHHLHDEMHAHHPQLGEVGAGRSRNNAPPPSTSRSKLAAHDTCVSRMRVRTRAGIVPLGPLQAIPNAIILRSGSSPQEDAVALGRSALSLDFLEMGWLGNEFGRRLRRQQQRRQQQQQQQQQLLLPAKTDAAAAPEEHWIEHSSCGTKRVGTRCAHCTMHASNKVEYDV